MLDQMALALNTLTRSRTGGLRSTPASSCPLSPLSFFMRPCEQDEEEPQADTLSDVDEDDIAAYLASPEEAELKEMLWKEMNKWVGAPFLWKAIRACQSYHASEGRPGIP